jgi:hypothetical protein
MNEFDRGSAAGLDSAPILLGSKDFDFNFNAMIVCLA